MTNKVILATFPLPDSDGCYWQVHVNGMPVTRETESQAQATASFERTCKDMSAHGRKVTRLFWNGYDATETVL